MSENYVSKWHKELEIFLRLKSIIILEGNIKDIFLYAENGYEVILTEYLNFFLQSKGYRSIVRYDSVYGFSAFGRNERELLDFADITKAQTPVRGGVLPVPFSGGEENAPDLVTAALTQEGTPCAVVMDMASRYIPSPENLSQASVNSFTQLMLAGSGASEVLSEDDLIRNTLIILADKINDLPPWFYLGNPTVKVIHIPYPSKEERAQIVDDDNFPVFFDPDIFVRDMAEYENAPAELEKIKQKFIGTTEGMTRLELRDLSRLCFNEKYSVPQFAGIVDLYRYGIKENPWSSRRLANKLRTAKERLERRVIGQEAAMIKTVNVINRAAAGLSGLQHSSHTKPKGILFFAGPTGTGKTEMAKSLAELLFGDESCCIRFDMSEYSQEHSDQKLLGAPPGYVGYEAGGQLTNAVRENPFSILLFDEIEKAHSSILDKFLQILEDGRMTDGQGRTVYFSETVIIFTSNLGIYDINENGRRVLNVTPDDDYRDVEEKVRKSISRYFKTQLGRPEILNRIGENIIVFDFIREEAARRILSSQLNAITSGLFHDNKVRLVIEAAAMESLTQKALSNLENGGRGIGNVVEEALLNPLAGFMLENDLINNAVITVENIETDKNPVEITAQGHALKDSEVM